MPSADSAPAPARASRAVASAADAALLAASTPEGLPWEVFAQDLANVPLLDHARAVQEWMESLVREVVGDVQAAPQGHKAKWWKM